MKQIILILSLIIPVICEAQFSVADMLQQMESPREKVDIVIYYPVCGFGSHCDSTTKKLSWSTLPSPQINTNNMKIVNKLAIIIATMAISCHPPQQELSKFSEGASMSNPIKLAAKTDGAATTEEYGWIKTHYKEYKILQQRLVGAPHGKDLYDVITIIIPGNSKVDLYFDITKSYGRL